MEYVIFIGAIIAICIIAKILAWPIKKILGLCINVLFGIGILILVNYIGANFNFHIPFNKITAVVSGFFGIPGVICLILLNFMV